MFLTSWMKKTLLQQLSKLGAYQCSMTYSIFRFSSEGSSPALFASLWGRHWFGFKSGSTPSLSVWPWASSGLLGCKLGIITVPDHGVVEGVDEQGLEHDKHYLGIIFATPLIICKQQFFCHWELHCPVW